MIVPMKKVAVIVQSKDANSCLDILGQTGVMHVEHQRPPKGKDISEIQDEISLLDKAVNILKKNGAETDFSLEKEVANWKFTSRHIIDLNDRLGRLEEYSKSLGKEISAWEGWGEFDPDEIKSLEEKNIHIRFYRIPVKRVKDFSASVIVKPISTGKGTADCVVISKGMVEVPFKDLGLPRMGLKKMRERLSEDTKMIEVIRGDIRKQASYFMCLMDVKKTLEKELEFHEALQGMGEAAGIMYLTGYIPHDEEKSFLKTARIEKWGAFVSDPKPGDRVPTLIRNPKWVSIISPVFKAMEIVPGYQELDISLWFLIFLSIFFGMLIGDAGYGVVFLLLTFAGQRKFAKKLKDRSIFILMYLLSSFAILWGVLTGAIFGQEWLPQSIRPLLPALREAKNVQTLCFFLGALHLSIAHLWCAAIKFPSPKALSDMGWVLILWGAFFLARTLILGDIFPASGKYFFIAGPLLVILFTNPARNVLKSIGSGVNALLLSFINTFTDVVSYIRLFAVGLASVAIADAFNKMAMDVGYNSIITGALTTLILLLGHTLNIVLGPLSILVHGVRLNVLEFCSHLDIKWSGFSYRPFQTSK